jgi:hypothetical protein
MPSGKGAQERRRLKRLPLQQKFENNGQQDAGGSQLDASQDAGAESNAVTPDGSPPASAGDGTAPRLRGGDMKGAAALLARQWGLDNHLTHSAAAPAASPRASRSRSSSSDEPVEDTALASSAAVAAVGGAPQAAPQPAQRATPATSFSRRKGPEERAREAREAEAQRAAASAPGAAVGPSGAAQDAAQDGVAARSEGGAAEACGAQPDAAPATPSTDCGSAADGLAIDVEEIRSDSERLQGPASNSAVSAPQHKSAVPKLNWNALVGGQDASLATSSTADTAGAGSKDSAQKSDSKVEGDVPPTESEKITRHAAHGQTSPYIAASKTQSLAAQVLVQAG